MRVTRLHSGDAWLVCSAIWLRILSHSPVLDLHRFHFAFPSLFLHLAYNMSEYEVFLKEVKNKRLTFKHNGYRAPLSWDTKRKDCSVQDIKASLSSLSSRR